MSGGKVPWRGRKPGRRSLAARVFGVTPVVRSRRGATCDPKYRADVVRLAWAGSPHGVPMVRRTAASWAAAVLEGRPLRPWLTSPPHTSSLASASW